MNNFYSIDNYSPRPTDLVNMTIESDMSALAERLAENSHLIWTKNAIDQLKNHGGIFCFAEVMKKLY